MKITVTSNEGLVLGIVNDVEKFNLRDTALPRKIESTLLVHFNKTDWVNWLRDEDSVPYDSEYLGRRNVKIATDPESGHLYVVELETRDPHNTNLEKPILFVGADQRMQLDAYLEYLEVKVVK